jgi:hypothetical protein
MNEIRRRWTRETQLDENGSRRLERGQSLIIVVFAFIGILALVGLSIDLGLVYVERVRAGRAADATALAAVAELPLEQAAQMRARDYLRDNGYDPDGANTRVVINPGADDEVVTGPDEVDEYAFPDELEHVRPHPHYNQKTGAHDVLAVHRLAPTPGPSERRGREHQQPGRRHRIRSLRLDGVRHAVLRVLVAEGRGLLHRG